MGTTAEKLQAIISAKADIGAAIREKGGAVPQKLSKYGDAIRALPSGGGNEVLLSPLDPVKAYETTRPTSLPALPETIEDNSIYLLFHQNVSASTSPVAFTVECDETYTVEIGRYSSATHSFEYGEPESIPSGAQYEKEDVGSVAASSGGYYLVRITGSSITKFAIGRSDLNGLTVYAKNCVEVVMKCPEITALELQNMKELMYATIKGTNKIKSGINLFLNCTSLILLVEFDFSSITSLASFFSGCHSLIACPSMDEIIGKKVNISNLFSNCHSLTVPPRGALESGIIGARLFTNCYSIKKIVLKKGTSDKPTNSIGAASFLGCVSLEEVKFMDGAVCSSSPFGQCISLKRLLFNQNLQGWAGLDLSLADCAFDHDGLVEMIKSLPTITQTRTITITGTPGASEVTEGEKAIAEAKHWKLV